MGKGDPNKPRGKMSSYAYFVQTCREEHKKKHPDTSVNFSEFSKKCSERWKSMSAKEKGKFEDLAKGDKARYEREMKTYIPPKGETKGKRKKDPNAPKRPPSAFFIFCSEHRPQIKSETPGLSIGDTAKKLGELWAEQTPKDKLPHEQKAAKLKEKYEKVGTRNTWQSEIETWLVQAFLTCLYWPLILTCVCRMLLHTGLRARVMLAKKFQGGRQVLKRRLNQRRMMMKKTRTKRMRRMKMMTTMMNKCFVCCINCAEAHCFLLRM
ncbi:hypothetical protein XELAEV_18005411mg [Xenopus laevis]|uniref:High mobility group protein B2 n=1 Tax=Xenopus laevis TaxID=8355 RepID=A0A974DX93_XENLA|nr:hypothetical protein XELAEV_18005411mg [Xenopus laevis]